MFVFGTQYLRGFTPGEKDWDRDLGKLKELGFNTVRVWLVWGVLEPRIGEIDFGYIDRFLSLASKHDLKVGFLFHFHGCPEWVSRKLKDCWYVNSAGIPFEPSARSNTPSGGWPGICPDFDTTKQLEENFISKIVQHVNDHPSVSFWEPMNEPHMWMDHTTPSGIFCQCKASRNAFRDWLKNKYETLENLEQAWGRRFSDWLDVRPPTWVFGYSDFIDWRTFTAENMVSHVERRAQIIRKNSKLPIIAHSWGSGCSGCTQLGSMAFDDWKLAKVVDQWGYSAFPHNLESMVSIGLGTDATRCASGDKIFWQSELGTGDLGTGLYHAGFVKPELPVLWTWESLRHGSQGVLYWQFRKEAHGSEFAGYAMSRYDGTPNDTAHALSDTGILLTQNPEIFKNVKPLPAKVALMFSYRSYMADYAAHRNNSMSVDCLNGWYRLFWDRNIPVDVLHEEFVSEENLKQYEMIILSNPVALHPKAWEPLKAFTAGGGVLLSDPYLCAFNENTALSTQIPGGGFSELFGCNEIDMHTAETYAFKVKYNNEWINIPKSRFMSEMNAASTGEVIAEFEDKTPAIVINPFGKGFGVMFGFNAGQGFAVKQVLGDQVERFDLPVSGSEFGRIFDDLLSRFKITSPIECHDDIKGTLLETINNQKLAILMNLSGETIECEVKIKDVVFKYCNDIKLDKLTSCENNTVPVVIQPYEVKALVLSR